jgi:hypothetical protein
LELLQFLSLPQIEELSIALEPESASSADAKLSASFVSAVIKGIQYYAEIEVI